MARCEQVAAVSGGPLSIADARAAVVASVAGALPAEEVAVGDALGRVLAEEVVAAGDVPAFANSAMDGFAVLAGPAGRELRVVDEARAGHPAGRAVSEGEAIRISTGAPVPEGATSVVALERVRDAGETVTLEREAAPGANIRGPGEDLRAGARVLAPGTRLRAGELGAAVAAGRAGLRCHRRPRVAVLVTGDELVAAGAPLGPGQIHDSNATLLAALAAEAGAEVVPGGAGAAELRAVGDDRAATEAALAAALEAADVVAVSGGVSVGRHDHVRPALAALGVQERFWRIALKPGKPAWFGVRGETLVFGLPGNPVSAAVCFVLLAAPALRALQGADPLPPARRARLAQDVAGSRDREQAVRVRLETDSGGALHAHPTGPQGSHVGSSLVGADGLAMIPSGDGVVPAGRLVAVEPM